MNWSQRADKGFSLRNQNYSEFTDSIKIFGMTKENGWIQTWIQIQKKNSEIWKKINEWMDSNMDPDIVGAFQYSSSSGLRLAVGSFVEDYDNKVQVKK